MGRSRARYNEKARSSSKLAKTARPHPNARDGGIKALAKKKGIVSTAEREWQEDMAGADPHTHTQPKEEQKDMPLDPMDDSDDELQKPHTQPDRAQEELQKIIDAQPNKVTSQKRKRLAKFIDKQLKKQDRKQLMEKLADQHMGKDQLGLFKSSKALGAVKMTAKETLRMALLEERAGMVSTNGDRLVVEKEVDESHWSAPMAEEAEEEDTTEEFTPAEIPKRKKKKQTKKPVVVKEKVGILSSGDESSDSEDNSSIAATEAADETEEGDFKAAVIPKRVKKKLRTGSQGDDSDNEPETKKAHEMWGADVVDGEKKVDTPQSNGLSASLSKPIVLKQDVRAAVKIDAKDAAPAFHVPLSRPPALQVARLSLPVVLEEQPIMEAIRANDVILLCGETGSGKTTQVPQFLYEAGFGDPKHPVFSGMVGVTQPRRVAAVAMAKRVAEEMGLQTGEVAYQVRYDRGLTGDKTRIKFMTDGILLRELSIAASGKANGKATPNADLLLSQYSCIIIDEAHERTVGTDVLIGWLTRIVALRSSGKVAGVRPLKLIIMSATLTVEDFTLNKALFPKPEQQPPVVKVDGRQHKVIIHYNKRTPDVDYISEALKKVTKIHTRLPPGAILVFLTGQQEIQVLVRKLRAAFPYKAAEHELERNQAEKESVGSAAKVDGMFEEAEEVEGVDDYEDGDDDLDMNAESEDDEEEDVDVLGGLSDDENDEDLANEGKTSGFASSGGPGPLHVLPLYSLLPTSAQLRVFESPPPGTRLVVVATNVAETSLTIPNVRYVVDTGKHKQRVHDTQSGLQTYQITWTSRASADQRAGRAGRTGPGHCYRLFSSAVYNDYFDQFSRPEILRTPIEGVVLQMKSMGINNVVGFPFPTPPGEANLRAAEKLLVHLGALDVSAGHTNPHMKITDLGKLMAKFPVSPRFAKMLIVAATQKGEAEDLLAYVIAVVAGLSVGDPFIRDEDIIGKVADDMEDDENRTKTKEEEEAKSRRSAKRAAFWKTMALFGGSPPTSDALRILMAVGAHAAESARRGGNVDAFCERHFVRPKAMDEMRKLRAQLTNLVKAVLLEGEDDQSSSAQQSSKYPFVHALSVDPTLKPPTARQSAAIRQILLAGYPDRVARLDQPLTEKLSRGAGKKREIPIYRTPWGMPNEACQIHPSSALASERPAPEFIIYEEVIGREETMAADMSGLVNTRGGAANSDVKRYWLKSLTTIDPSWLAPLAPPSLCRPGKVLEQPEPRYDATKDAITGLCLSNYGPLMWELPPREIPLPRMTDRCTWFLRRVMEAKVPMMQLSASELRKQRYRKQQKKAQVKKAGKVWDSERDGSGELVEVWKLLNPYWLIKPVTITKAWGKTQQKIKSIVETMVNAQVDSRNSIVQKWREQPQFLLREVLPLIPDEFHAALTAHWPLATLSTEDDDGDQITKDAMRRENLVRAVSQVIN
ncbi:P-loop containing nucleoside triphosphate hydrolase protein [Phlyctochytrium arcticum]|nr:P-loop containing nucleoside triphosphate hydrolase protein [Phlyctochytrium arcticum]